MAGFERIIFPALNHLVQNESWARERLRQFSGSQLLIAAGRIQLNLRINEQGLFALADISQPADVLLTLPADAPLKFLFDRNALFSTIKLSGSADLAECLAFVFRNLHWDIESDLASILGDIPARRLAQMGSQLGNQMQDSAKRISQNFVEFSTEDSQLLTATRDIHEFCQAVDNLRDDTARLEKRIKQL